MSRVKKRQGGTEKAIDKGKENTLHNTQTNCSFTWTTPLTSGM